MDIEYSGGMAPGAQVDYYEAPTDIWGNPTNQGLEDALNQAGSDTNTNRQITNSWGECEASSLSDPFTSATNNIFASKSATGHNYFFSSGDNGSWCAPNGVTGQDPYPNYPASSPYVTSVGGTTLSNAINGSYPGEGAWTYCATCNGGDPEGSGGGYSTIFSRPSWQIGSGLANNGKRGITLAFAGEATVLIDTLTGYVTSPEPYLRATLTVHLIKAQSFAQLFKTQFELNTLLGDATVRPDAATMQPYSLSNCSLMGIGDQDFSGAEVDYPVQISGLYYVNSTLFL